MDHTSAQCKYKSKEGYKQRQHSLVNKQIIYLYLIKDMNVYKLNRSDKTRTCNNIMTY